MTLFILAYPEEEWRRLENVVMSMPIDADGDLVDGKPERLPKQIVSAWNKVTCFSFQGASTPLLQPFL